MTVHPRAPVHPASTAPPPATVQLALSTGSCSITPPRATVHPSLHRLLFNQPSMGPVHPPPTGSIGVLFIQRQQPLLPRGPVHPTPTGNNSSTPPPTTLTVHQEGSRFDRLQLAALAKESLDRVQLTARSIDRSGSVTCSLECNRSSSVGDFLTRVHLEPNALHPRAYVYERNVHRSVPTTHRNRELPEIPPLASSTIFSVMDSPNNVMHLRLRPAQDEKPIFCHDFLS